MNVGEYVLLNEEKAQRALLGTPGPEGGYVGGVQKPDGTYNELELLAEYDKMGGAIKKGTDKVKMGSFYDFKNKKPRAKPVVTFEFRINGKVVEVGEGEEVPNVVKAARVLAGEEGEETKGKGKGKGKKAKEDAEDAE